MKFQEMVSLRQIIAAAVLLLSLFIAACSKSGTVSVSNNNRAQVSLDSSSAQTPVWGSGQPAASAIENSATTAGAAVKSPLPPPAGFVNDFAEVIDEQTKLELETRLRKFKEDSRVEFAVVTVKTTGEQATADYASAVARGWGIGPKDKSGGGLILLIAIEDHRWSLRWSSSLNADLQNGTEDELQRRMTGPFRQSNYSEGISNGVNAVMSKLARQQPVSRQD